MKTKLQTEGTTIARCSILETQYQKPNIATIIGSCVLHFSSITMKCLPEMRLVYVH